MNGLKLIVLVAISVVVTSPRSLSQSHTTGTLKLQNGSLETVSLSIPSGAVTPYTVLFPPTGGSQGDQLVVSATAGNTVSLGWSETAYWGLSGSSITNSGVGVGEQYLGTSNNMDLVIASAGAERMRIIGTSGPTAGFTGIGTNTPVTLLTVAGSVSLAGSGAAAQLRLYEPSAGGTNFTAFQSAQQATDIVYTLPDSPPAETGAVLAGNPDGSLSWTNRTQLIGRGIYVPVTGAFVHVIPLTGFDLTPGGVVVVSIVHPPGTTIACSITKVDYVLNEITTETSVPLANAGFQINWIAVNP